MGKFAYALIVAGAGALAYGMYKQNVFGALPVACAPEPKTQARLWMEEVQAYKKPEKVEATTIDQATGMAQDRLVEYADLLRGRQPTPDREFVAANGIGRPL